MSKSKAAKSTSEKEVLVKWFAILTNNGIAMATPSNCGNILLGICYRSGIEKYPVAP